MPKFRVWCLDDGEGPDDGRNVTAYDAEQAAEIWAERDDAESASYRIVGGKSEPIVVVEAPGGSQSRFRLTGEAEPRYSAHPA